MARRWKPPIPAQPDFAGSGCDCSEGILDVEHYREMRNDQLLQRVQKFAELVRETGSRFTSTR